MSNAATNSLSGGIVHNLPTDLSTALNQSVQVVALWESLTPIARNEYICWVEDAKKLETRQKRIGRTVESLLEGKRRPCCWPGCRHRNDKPQRK